MIDIHCHALYGVDDGADNIEESAAMLRQARLQGVEAVILTPHYRHGMFAYPKQVIVEHFEKLKPLAQKAGVRLYLGCEYHVNSRMIEALQTGRCLSLADGDFVLTEYSFETEYSYISGQTRRLISNGYIPVLAHVERYECLLKKPRFCAELSEVGAYIQVNADSILGLAGKTAEKFCRKLLKNRWADLVASDAHGKTERVCRLGECRDYVAKKYGEGYAKLLFQDNPQRILDSGN